MFCCDACFPSSHTGRGARRRREAHSVQQAAASRGNSARHSVTGLSASVPPSPVATGAASTRPPAGGTSPPRRPPPSPPIKGFLSRGGSRPSSRNASQRGDRDSRRSSGVVRGDDMVLDEDMVFGAGSFHSRRRAASAMRRSGGGHSGGSETPHRISEVIKASPADSTPASPSLAARRATPPRASPKQQQLQQLQQQLEQQQQVYESIDEVMRARLVRLSAAYSSGSSGNAAAHAYDSVAAPFFASARNSRELAASSTTSASASDEAVYARADFGAAPVVTQLMVYLERTALHVERLFLVTAAADDIDALIRRIDASRARGAFDWFSAPAAPPSPHVAARALIRCLAQQPPLIGSPDALRQFTGTLVRANAAATLLNTSAPLPTPPPAVAAARRFVNGLATAVARHELLCLVSLLNAAVLATPEVTLFSLARAVGPAAFVRAEHGVSNAVGTNALAFLISVFPHLVIND